MKITSICCLFCYTHGYLGLFVYPTMHESARETFLQVDVLGGLCLDHIIF